MAMNAQEQENLLDVLKIRYEKNSHRHEGTDWATVHARLIGNSAVLRSLQEMEATGGEPDVIGKADEAGNFVFCDCSQESPAGRRSTCYDAKARASRKENKPKISANELAAKIGIELLT